MTEREGGFYSAEDADSLTVAGGGDSGRVERHGPAGVNAPGYRAEGAFYVWSKDEIDRVLGAEGAKIFEYHYAVEQKGNAPEDPQGEFKDKSILIQRHDVADTAKKFGITKEKADQLLAESRKVLFETRAKRPRPTRDDKIVTAWNGLMISAFARAYQVLDDPAYLQVASRAADFVQQKLCRADKKTLLRSFREGANVNGFASDYAFLVQGLLDLYEASFDTGWIEWAVKLQQRQDELFGDAKKGAYYSTSEKDPDVLLRMKEADDTAEPSPNSVTALNLLRIGYMFDQADARYSAEKTMKAFATQIERAPALAPQMLVALSWSRSKPKQVVIVGKADDAATQAMLREVYRHFVPHEVLILADGGKGQQFFGDRVEFMKSVTETDGKPTAYVCENFVCQLPTTDLKALANLLSPQSKRKNSARPGS
jgi:uncharacterized protein